MHYDGPIQDRRPLPERRLIRHRAVQGAAGHLFGGLGQVGDGAGDPPDTGSHHHGRHHEGQHQQAQQAAFVAPIGGLQRLPIALDDEGPGRGGQRGEAGQGLFAKQAVCVHGTGLAEHRRAKVRAQLFVEATQGRIGVVEDPSLTIYYIEIGRALSRSQPGRGRRSSAPGEGEPDPRQPLLQWSGRTVAQPDDADEPSPGPAIVALDGHAHRDRQASRLFREQIREENLPVSMYERRYRHAARSVLSIAGRPPWVGRHDPAAHVDDDDAAVKSAQPVDRPLQGNLLPAGLEARDIRHGGHRPQAGAEV